MNAKYIIKRILADWKQNSWLALELLIVSVAAWMLTDELFVRQQLENEDLGFDIEGTYLVDIQTIGETSPAYDPSRAGSADVAEDTYALVERLERDTEVECVGLSWNSYPYNASNSGTQLRLVTEKGDTLYRSGVMRYVSPGFLRVFRYRGANGETPEQLGQLLERNPEAMIVSENFFRPEKADLNDLVGTSEIEENTGQYEPRKLAGVMKTVKYQDNARASSELSLIRLGRDDGHEAWFTEVTLREKPGTSPGLKDRLMEKASAELHVGNVYVSAIRPFSQIRKSYVRETESKKRNKLIIVVFLLANVFLGLLGTFWMRTSQRTGELAIMKVSGASGRSVFTMLLTEGLLILVLVTPLAVVTDINLALGEYNTYGESAYLEWPRLAATAAIVFGTLALSVVLGVALPAMKAMRVNPAEAIRTE